MGIALSGPSLSTEATSRKMAGGPEEQSCNKDCRIVLGAEVHVVSGGRDLTGDLTEHMEEDN